MEMKKVIIGISVPSEKVKELTEKINELVAEKKGEVKEINVINAPPKGSGATLGSVL